MTQLVNTEAEVEKLPADQAPITEQLPTQEELVKALQEQHRRDFSVRALRNQLTGEYLLEVMTAHASMTIPYMVLKEIVSQIDTLLIKFDGNIPVQQDLSAPIGQ